MKSDVVILDNSDFVKAADAMQGRGMQQQLGETAEWAIRRIGTSIRQHVIRALQRHRRTGRLQSLVKLDHTPVSRGLDFVSLVASTGPVAHLVHGGVKVHRIPKEGSSERPMPIGGGFAYSVWHPGFTGDPYFDRGIRESRRDVDRIVDKAAEQLVDRLAERIERGR